MTVSEYEDRFRDLSRYAPAEACGEEALARNFSNGLLPKISRVVATLDLSTVLQISKAARRMHYQDARHPREPKRVKTEGSSGGSVTTSIGAGRGASRGVACSEGRSQIGQCYCRGHIGEGSSTSRGQARVYHLTR